MTEMKGAAKPIVMIEVLPVMYTWVEILYIQAI